MKTAVVFGPLNSLDFKDIRQNIVRIPEVGMRLNEAQAIWDEVCGNNFSFHQFMCSDDHSFYNNVNLKTLTFAIVQLGLYDRYVRRQCEPNFLVGNTQNDTALLVAARTLSLKKLILNSPALSSARPMSTIQVAVDTVLMGQSLPQFQAFSLAEAQEQGCAVGEAQINLEQILVPLVEKHKVQKIVYVGPGLMNKSQCFTPLHQVDIQVVESIDADPMLQWFWSDLRKYDEVEARAQ